ncbi:helicase-associated domain-containing protein [Cellulomonas composti]|uniref:Helicase XPB/Ssl2 N-terminal domain-containing protein n=1 Tax=Cellulomonas composti TaxID=266130 RepID=A0A511JD04_9CELL|nr:helicase-associated domain-containing protein [Cellulomonas composti]GEL95854.1 hypothetical protein CCO02nite_25120 [Cellulomonas composti]
MATFSGYLRSSSDEQLVALLGRRPDLASPSPGNLTSLAVRATGRGSLERALAGVDAVVLQVLEAVVVLDGATRAQVAQAVAGGHDPEVARALDDALTLALLFVDDATPDDERSGDKQSGDTQSGDTQSGDTQHGEGRGDGLLRAAPGLVEVLGAHPAGLATDVPSHAPAASTSRTNAPTSRTSRPTIDRGSTRSRTPDPTSSPTSSPTSAAAAGADQSLPPGLAAALETVLAGEDESSLAGRAILDALTWGPPVGLAPAVGTSAGDAVLRLVEQGLLVRGQGRHVLLPGAVALVLRGGRTHRGVATIPDLDTGSVRPAATVTAESAGAGERCARLVARLARRWEAQPPGVLRAGGLAVRELKRVAAELEVDDAQAAFVVELAGAAGLVGPDEGEPPVFVPTTELDPWLALDLPARWVALARAWLTTTRTPWLVGSRDEKGTVRAALDPELRRPWAPRLRRSVLGAFADAPAGSAPDVDDVLALLTWATPRSVPPRAAVAAVLAEAGWLGILGAGALSEAGRAVLADDVDGATTRFAAGLPPEVDDLLLQGDLTGIVPGRPGATLEALLDVATVVESRGGALTVRFTPDSVRAALDEGRTADELLAELGAFARGPVPQPLDYLVRDAARRHGRLRAGTASSYLRADDPALLAGLADDPRLASLGLLQLAPTVLAAQAPTREVVETLREHGLAPVAETPDGLVLHLERPVRRARRRHRRTEPGAPPSELAALVRRLRTGAASTAPTPSPVPSSGSVSSSDTASSSGSASSSGTALAPGRRGTADPAEALALLREAAADRTQVWVELVGPTGQHERRLLRPLRVEGGRLRAADALRESELSVAVHRIATVTRADDEKEDV